MTRCDEKSPYQSPPYLQLAPSPTYDLRLYLDLQKEPRNELRSEELAVDADDNVAVSFEGTD